jgi:hypothetical protein
MDMNCDKIKALLGRYIDGRLGRNDITEIEHHLMECSSCTAHYEKLLGLEKIANDFLLGGDESFWEQQKDKIMARIERTEKAKVVMVPRRRWATAYRLTALAASIAIIAFISVREYQQYHPEQKLMETEPISAPAPAPEIQSEAIDIQSDNSIVTSDQAGSNEKTVTGKEPIVSQRPKDQEKPDAKKEAGQGIVYESIDQRSDITTSGISAPPEISDEKGKETEEEGSTLAIQAPVKIETDAAADIYKSITVEPSQEVKTVNIAVPKSTVPTEANLVAEKPNKKSIRAESNSIAELSQVTKVIKSTTMTAGDDNKKNNMPADSLSLYMEWRRKAELLKADYSRLTNGPKSDTDSISTVINSLAEAYFNMGRYTKSDEVRLEMITNLEELSAKVDRIDVSRISELITVLRNITK